MRHPLPVIIPVLVIWSSRLVFCVSNDQGIDVLTPRMKKERLFVMLKKKAITAPSFANKRKPSARAMRRSPRVHLSSIDVVPFAHLFSAKTLQSISPRLETEKKLLHSATQPCFFFLSEPSQPMLTKPTTALITFPPFVGYIDKCPTCSRVGLRGLLFP